MLGSYLVKQLAAAGWGVRALVRDPGAARWLTEKGEGGGGGEWVELARGDVRELEDLHRAAAGCDVIFHTAAVIGTRGAWELFRRVNVSATEHVIAAAQRAGARLVHASSTSVYGGRARYRSTPTDESTPLPELPERDLYGRSKQEAERLVLHAHAEGRLWACAVRPPVMYGIRDRQFVPRIAPVLERGIFPLVGGGRSVFTIVHAGAVAEGMLRAARTERAGGQAYNLTNDVDVTVADFVRLAARGLGARVRTPVIGRSLAAVGFRVLGVGLAALGRRDLAFRAGMALDMLSRGNPFSSARARKELGWLPAVDPEVTIPEAFRWWKAHRHTPRP
jgi:UDP-glucose 4-epimerase